MNEAMTFVVPLCVGGHMTWSRERPRRTDPASSDSPSTPVPVTVLDFLSSVHRAWHFEIHRHPLLIILVGSNLRRIRRARSPLGPGDYAAPQSTRKPPHGTARRRRATRDGLLLGHVVCKLGAGLHPELAERLAQVVVDRARTDEQPRRDLCVRAAVCRHTAYLGFLWG